MCLKANIQRECETAAVHLIAIAGGVFLTTRLHKYYSPSAERIASVRVHVKQHVKHTHNKKTHISCLCWEMDVFIGGGGGGRVGGSIAGASLHIHENTAPLNYRYVRAPETRWSVEP